MEDRSQSAGGKQECENWTLTRIGYLEAFEKAGLRVAYDPTGGLFEAPGGKYYVRNLPNFAGVEVAKSGIAIVVRVNSSVTKATCGNTRQLSDEHGRLACAIFEFQRRLPTIRSLPFARICGRLQ